MPSKNSRGVPLKKVPDNQQERPEIAGWICGFVDGEGCFSVSIIRNSTTSSGWQIFPEFVVTQGEKSRSSLELIQSYFQCGQIYENHRSDNHKEHLLRYCVRSKKDLLEIVIPFFEKHTLNTAKRDDFQKFVRILNLIKVGKHLSKAGMTKIAKIIQSMNRRVPSRFLESSETTCWISPKAKKI